MNPLKYSYCLLLGLLWLVSCKKDPAVSTIVGSVENCEDCQVMLKFKDMASLTDIERTQTKVKNGNFIIRDTLLREGRYEITIDGNSQPISMYLPADTVKVTLSEQPDKPTQKPILRSITTETGMLNGKNIERTTMNYLNVQVTSTSPVQQDLERYFVLKDSMQQEYDKAYKAQVAQLSKAINAMVPKAKLDQEGLLVTNFPERRERMIAKAATLFIKERPESEATFLAMLDNRDDRAAAVKFRQYFASLPPERQESYYGKIVNQRIARWEQRNPNVQRFVGRQITFLAGQTPQGNKLEADKIFKQNKYTLVDFWASWCDSCLIQVPAYQKLYQNYHPKGFEIIAISLDDNQQEWTAAIKKSDYPGQHISELQGGKGSDIIRFRLYGIPSNVLIDQNGKIAAFNITPEKLKSKLQQL